MNENTAPNIEKSGKKNKRKGNGNGTLKKRKRLKRDVKDGEETTEQDLSLKTNKETPNSNNKSPIKSDAKPSTNLIEEDQVMEENLNKDGGKAIEEEKTQDKPKRSKRGRKPKANIEEAEPSIEIKRERKLIEKYETQLDDWIKAGIDSQLNFGDTMIVSHQLNLKLLSEFIEKHEVIDLKDPETQIIFVKTFSYIINESTLPLSELVSKWMSALAAINAQASSKIQSKDFEDFIKVNAERKSYGKILEWEDPLNNTNPEALYCWEVVNTSLIDGAVAKDINLTRGSRNFISDKIKAISKIIKLITNASKSKDLDKINNEKEKLEKIERKETAHNQKITQRILQIKEKQAKEEAKIAKKKQSELEKQLKEKQKKEEAERKKKLEQEEKERKREEAARIKQEQEEAKKKRQEEILKQKALKKQREEEEKKRKEEEKKKKEEEIRLQKEKEENAQKKLMTFFSKKT